MMQRITSYISLLAIVVTVFSLAVVQPVFSANVVVVNNDLPNEGFNDNTPFTPQGGNPSTTLGAARLFAFQYAANLWGACLSSSVTIEIGATMDPLFCTATQAVLGAAGATFINRDFTGAPRPGTWYHLALSNALEGLDALPGPGGEEVVAQFNSNLNGHPSCLGGTKWYYGVDGNPPGSDIDFVTVVMHEIAHGIGFSTFVNLGTGAKFQGFDDTYMLNLENHGAVPSDYPSMTDFQRVLASTSDPNLHWTGNLVNIGAGNLPLTGGLVSGHVRMHGPNPAQSGSSVSHFSTALFPNETMEPFYTVPNHDASLAANLMADVGWTLLKIPTSVPDTPAPAGFKLLQNYPNPFKPSTEISFELPDARPVRLRVYDVKGRLVRTLIDGKRPAGAQSASWDGKDYRGRPVASGVYFYKIDAEGFAETRRMVLLK